MSPIYLRMNPLIRSSRAAASRRYVRPPLYSQLQYLETVASPFWRRKFSSTRPLAVVKSYLLADIGEGIVECQIIKWFVKPGDEIEQFAPLCEAQSDKAAVEITSPYEGKVKIIHVETDGMAKVGAPLVDIDVKQAEDEVEDQDQASTSTTTFPIADGLEDSTDAKPTAESTGKETEETNSPPMLPSIRRMLRDHGLNASDVTGTGKNGRISSDDIQKHLGASPTSQPGADAGRQDIMAQRELAVSDNLVQLTPVQKQMMQTMSSALDIPHLYFTQKIDVTSLTALRQRTRAKKSLTQILTNNTEPTGELRVLPFVLKALSLSVAKFPILNATFNAGGDTASPQLTMRGEHHFGVAMDTPRGLLVPVIRNVQDHSILSLAAEVDRLGALARANRLSPDDLKGATLVVSNIGSLGGFTVGPVILPPMVAIVGIGRSERVASVVTDDHGEEKIGIREQLVLSWSADHRVIDGATVAKCARVVETCLQNVDAMSLAMR